MVFESTFKLMDEAIEETRACSTAIKSLTTELQTLREEIEERRKNWEPR